MNTTDLVVVLGTVLVAQELVHYLPQPLKIRRKGSIAGVSPSAVTLIAVMSLVWLGFAVWEQAWAAVASGTVVAALAGWTVVEVARHGGNVGRMIRVGAFSSTVVAAVTLSSWAAGLESVGLSALLLAATAAHGIPRLVVGLTAPSLRGLSALYLSLNVCDGLLYGLYGFAADIPTYTIFAVLQVATSLPVLLRWLARPDLRDDTPRPRLSLVPS
jgi:hypothetical protein